MRIDAHDHPTDGGMGGADGRAYPLERVANVVPHVDNN
jgi:hypothetical protein